LSRNLILFCFTLIYLINFSNNLGVSASDKVWYTSAKLVGYPREAFFSALKNGILRDAKGPLSILLIPSAPWAENSVLKIESDNSKLLFINSWWRFAEKPSSIPDDCPEIATICKTSKPLDILLISAEKHNRSYVAFFKSNLFYVPKEYDKNGPLSGADFKIDAATTRARVMFTSGKPCNNFGDLFNKLDTDIEVLRNLDFDVPTYRIESANMFWLRGLNLDKCR
jgi:hypothetical protein